MKALRIGIPTDYVKGEEVLRSAFTGDTYSTEQKNVFLEEIHKEFQGEGVVIGVCDSGWHKSHVDIDYNNIESMDTYGGEGVDISGHGFHVLGIMAMQKNGQGLIGVSPKSKFKVAKVLDGESGTGTYSKIAKGIRWCADQGCDLINLSLGAPHSSNSTVLNSAIDYAYSKGCYCVVASGNEDQDEIGYPARLKNVISVGAIDKNKVLASFSNKGVNLDTVSYGVNIISTAYGDKYRSSSGTSMACPFATGLIALFIQSFRLKTGSSPTFSDIYDWIKSCSEDIQTEGFDVGTGFGIVGTNFDCPKILDENKEDEQIDPEDQTSPVDIIEDLAEKIEDLKSDFLRIKLDLLNVRNFLNRRRVDRLISKINGILNV